jgi:hypothetical protein
MHLLKELKLISAIKVYKILHTTITAIVILLDARCNLIVDITLQLLEHIIQGGHPHAAGPALAWHA